jgi:hypothetical protein
MTPERAELIAFVAHTACGQYRADGKTPYVAHPRRVADLVEAFCARMDRATGENMIVAAWLHDVLEDTKLTREDLLHLGITYAQLDVVERLTKPDDGPAPASYYQGISESEEALIVKAADRISNLEDALQELLVAEPLPRRWAKYVEKTVRDVIPMYVKHIYLRGLLQHPVDAINAALPAAMERRALVVARELADGGRAMCAGCLKAVRIGDIVATPSGGVCTGCASGIPGDEMEALREAVGTA